MCEPCSRSVRTNSQYDNICFIIAPGAMTEVDALRRVVAEAEEKAAPKQALREKHEARVIKAEQELQEAVRKCETLEQSLTEKEPELTKARQATSDARG